MVGFLVLLLLGMLVLGTKGAALVWAWDVLVWFWWVDPVVVSLIYAAALCGVGAAVFYRRDPGADIQWVVERDLRPEDLEDFQDAA